MSWTKVSGGENSISVRWKKEGDDAKSTYFGESIQGVYEMKKENVGVKDGTIYSVRHPEHGLLSVWGGLTALDNAMAKVPFNSEVLIEHKGLQKTKNGTEFRAFEVSWRPVPFIPTNEQTVHTTEEVPLPPV